MPQTFKVYDPDKVSIGVAGIPVTGFADGVFITVEHESDIYSDVCGADGEVARSKNNDRRATVTITLMQTSDSNDALSALHSLDRATSGGGGVGAFILRDQEGRTILSATESWIARPPDASFDRTAGPREWKIRIANLIEFHGGN